MNAAMSRLHLQDVEKLVKELKRVMAKVNRLDKKSEWTLDEEILFKNLKDQAKDLSERIAASSRAVWVNLF